MVTSPETWVSSVRRFADTNKTNGPINKNKGKSMKEINESIIDCLPN